jgi:hypothetical protein
MAVRLGGFVAKTCTARTYWAGAPDDLEDAYVRKDGRVREVWDVGIDLVDGKVALYGNWPDAYLVDAGEQIFYSPPERWA